MRGNRSGAVKDKRKCSTCNNVFRTQGRFNTSKAFGREGKVQQMGCWDNRMRVPQEQKGFDRSKVGNTQGKVQ